MYKITEKVALNPTVTKMVIEAPLIAKKAKPGQFIIVRPFEDSERIPLTVAGYDREKGTVDIIFQIVGGTTMELNSLNAGDCVHDFVGPLGRATETEGLKKVCVVGGGTFFLFCVQHHIPPFHLVSHGCVHEQNTVAFYFTNYYNKEDALSNGKLHPRGCGFHL